MSSRKPSDTLGRSCRLHQCASWQRPERCGVYCTTLGPTRESVCLSVTNSDTLCLVLTVNGTVETNEKATVPIKYWDMFLCVKLVDDSRAVLSLGTLCETMGHSYTGKMGEQRSQTKSGITD